MPKKKTNKAAAKRFKVTATGKVVYAKAGSGHLLVSAFTGQPLILVVDGQAGSGRESFAELPHELGARSFTAVHVVGHADDEPPGVMQLDCAIERII